MILTTAPFSITWEEKATHGMSIPRTSLRVVWLLSILRFVWAKLKKALLPVVLQDTGQNRYYPDIWFLFFWSHFLLNNANLKDYKYLIFYVKGDPLQGFTRKFVVELKNIDQSDKFLVNGVSSSWQKVVIPLGRFKRIGEWGKMTELTIVFNENVTRKTGTIYLDNIYFAQYPEEPLGEEPSSGKSPLQGSTKEYSEEKKTELGATIYTGYSYTPEEKNEIFSMGSVSVEGRLSRFSGKMEIQAETQNFGKAAYRAQLENWPYEETQRQSPDVEFPTLQFTVDDILPQASRIRLGHLWLDSTRYTFNPVYGWKGASIEGDYHGLNYNTFFIKQPFNSFTLGSHFRQ